MHDMHDIEYAPTTVYASFNKFCYNSEKGSALSSLKILGRYCRRLLVPAHTVVSIENELTIAIPADLVSLPRRKYT